MILQRYALTLTILLGSFIICNGQKKIVTPIEGEYGKDYIIVNHVDWGILDTVRDAWCGTKSYNGHQGTDFTLRNFNQMDSGVNILACDTGVVTFIQDGLFDEETEGIISRGLGNYIAIAHSGKFYSYYGHLKKNSILVKEGDRVLPGQVIAQVGSSGNSTDPHLHFEWWFDSSILIDPFSAPCGNSYSYWQNQLPYDTSFALWHSGLTDDSLDLNKIRFQEERIDVFREEEMDTRIINYWNLMYGLRKGDSITIEWYNESFAAPYFKNTIPVNQDYWYYYYWNLIDFPDELPGRSENWHVLLKRNDIIVDSLPFEVWRRINVQKVLKENFSVFYSASDKELKIQQKENQVLELSIFNTEGKLVKQIDINRQKQSINCSKWVQGVYIVKAKYKKGTGEQFSQRVMVH